jgi:uncharacterized protein YjiS (DUF1127 family)
MALAGMLLRAVKSFVVALRNRRQVARLTDLDDRALKDIGLTRSDVMAALDQPFLRDPSMHLTSVAGVRRGRPAAGPSPGVAMSGAGAAKLLLPVEAVMQPTFRPQT